MFNFNPEDPDLVEAIADGFRDLKGFDAHSEEYQKAVDQLVKLHSLKKKRVDPNTALTVAGNLAIGVAVLKHERTAVITSKVWSFLTKK